MACHTFSQSIQQYKLHRRPTYELAAAASAPGQVGRLTVAGTPTTLRLTASSSALAVAGSISSVSVSSSRESSSTSRTVCRGICIRCVSVYTMTGVLDMPRVLDLRRCGVSGPAASCFATAQAGHHPGPSASARMYPCLRLTGGSGPTQHSLPSQMQATCRATCVNPKASMCAPRSAFRHVWQLTSGSHSVESTLR